MKFAIGLMACIAIAFTFVTSPQSQPKASYESSASVEAMSALSDAVRELQYQLSSDRDSIEKQMNARFTAMATSQAKLTSTALEAMPDSDELWTAVKALEAKQAELEAKVAQLEALKTSSAVKATSGGSTGGGSTGGGSAGGYTQIVQGTQSTQTTGSYSPRWTNSDGRSLRDHMIDEHGFDPSLTTAQMVAMHDAYHDQYGPASPNLGARTSNVAVQLASPTSGMTGRTVTRTRSNVTNDCPGGSCPVTSGGFSGSSGMSRSVNVQSRGGLLGRGIIRFRR